MFWKNVKKMTNVQHYLQKLQLFSVNFKFKTSSVVTVDCNSSQRLLYDDVSLVQSWLKKKFGSQK